MQKTNILNAYRLLKLNTKTNILAQELKILFPKMFCVDSSKDIIVNIFSNYLRLLPCIVNNVQLIITLQESIRKSCKI